MKRNNHNRRKLYGMFILLLMSFVWLPAMKVNASEKEILAKIEKLQEKYPNGKYWNHVGSDKENVDGYTSKPCELHKTSGIHVSGTNGCTCNHFGDASRNANGVLIGHYQATQCMGFANKLANDIFGVTAWYKYENPSESKINEIRIGDIVRLDGNAHSVFVIAKNGKEITVAEANYPKNCQIQWGRKITLSTSNVTYYEHASNYDSVTGTELTSKGTGELKVAEQPTTEKPTTEQPTTEQPTTQNPSKPFTGWKKTSNGLYDRYYIDGKVQKEKWLTIDGKDYYVNEKGYLLKSQWLYKNNVLVYVKKNGAVAKSELVKIGSNKYVFDSKGGRSKGFHKVGKVYYYSDVKGIILRKQWLVRKDKTYYLRQDGVRAASKMLRIGKYYYYFDAKGVMAKSQKVTWKNVIYKADKKGRCKKIGIVKS